METIKELRNKVQGERVRNNPWYGRLVMRKISIYITWLLLHTFITANQVTLVMIIIGWIACIFFIVGTPLFFLFGALTLQVWWLLDHVDGEIAVYKGEYCITGIYFDVIAHYLAHPLVMLSLGVGIFHNTNNFTYLAAGGLASFSSILLDIIHQTKYCVMFHRYIKNAKLDVSPFEKKEVNAKEVILQESLFGKLLKEYCLYPGVMNLITLAALIDLINHVYIHYFSFTFLGILIISYGAFYPASCLKTLIQIIQKREIDTEYYYYFEK